MSLLDHNEPWSEAESAEDDARNDRFEIVNHKIVGAVQVPTVHTSGTIKPDLIVIHETASRLGKRNVVNYLKRNDRKVSYHVVIERDGEVVQMAPLNARCHHAGKSVWQGRKFCNNFSIGIGMVGPGALKGSPQKAKSWFGEWYTADDGIVDCRSPYHGNDHLWLSPTTAQQRALDDLVRSIKAAYPGIQVAGHYHVSPGRKIDPPPMLDLAALGGPLVPSEGHMTVSEDMPSRKIVAAGSKTYQVAGAGKAVAGTAVLGAGAAEVVKELGTASQGASTVKQIIDTTASIASAYGLVAVAVIGVAAFFVFQWLQDRRVAEHEAGRYETEGEA